MMQPVEVRKDQVRLTRRYVTVGFVTRWKDSETEVHTDLFTPTYTRLRSTSKYNPKDCARAGKR